MIVSEFEHKAELFEVQALGVDVIDINGVILFESVHSAYLSSCAIQKLDVSINLVYLVSERCISIS